jgi:hypothetical protein
LDVAAVLFVFAAVPQVVSGLRRRTAAGGGDEGAVQAYEGPSFVQALGEYIVQVGSLRGGHVDRLVQVPVGGRDAHPGVSGEDARIGSFLEPAQHHDGLDERGRGALPRA